MATLNDDIMRALFLVKNLRLIGIRSNINPRAMRIALKYALLVDDHFAKQRVTPAEDKKLDAIARRLFEKAVKSWGKNHKIAS